MQRATTQQHPQHILQVVETLNKIKLYKNKFTLYSAQTPNYVIKIYTFQGLEMGAVDILIVWENLEIHRIVLKNHQTDGKLRS